jgi:hypothetical protein
MKVVCVHVCFGRALSESFSHPFCIGADMLPCAMQSIQQDVINGQKDHALDDGAV